jgi:hypothetical protein
MAVTNLVFHMAEREKKERNRIEKILTHKVYSLVDLNFLMSQASRLVC